MPVVGLPARGRRALASSRAPGSERLGLAHEQAPESERLGLAHEQAPGSARPGPVPRVSVCGLALGRELLVSASFRVSFRASGLVHPVRSSGRGQVARW